MTEPVVLIPVETFPVIFESDELVNEMLPLASSVKL